MTEISRTSSSLALQLSEACFPIIGGYALNLLFEQATVRCLFDSHQSAALFHRFCELYVSDAQPGNAYGGYFPQDFTSGSNRPYRIFFPRTSRYFDIWPRTVERMFHAICYKRLSVDFIEPNHPHIEALKQWEHAVPEIQNWKGYHHFNFDESLLPPRLLPTALGQFVSVIDDPRYRRELAYYVADVGPKALIALFYPNTSPSDEHLVLVDRKHLMRIYDFYEASDIQCGKTEFRLKRDRLLDYACSRLRELHDLPNLRSS